MLRVGIEEASRWDLVPKPAILRWTSTYDPEERWDISMYTTTVYHKFPFEERFRILGFAMDRQGQSHDAIEERMQSANKALLERYSDIQKQGRPVEDQVSTTGGCSFLLWE